MNPTEGWKLTLKGQEYVLRLTVPRLREMNSRTGKGTRQLWLEASGLNFDSLTWLLWAAIAHPANKAVKDITVDKVMDLYDLIETGSICGVMADVITGSFKKGDPADPQQPTTQQ